MFGVKRPRGRVVGKETEEVASLCGARPHLLRLNQQAGLVQKGWGLGISII